MNIDPFNESPAEQNPPRPMSELMNEYLDAYENLTAGYQLPEDLSTLSTKELTEERSKMIADINSMGGFVGPVDQDRLHRLNQVINNRHADYEEQRSKSSPDSPQS